MTSKGSPLTKGYWPFLVPGALALLLIIILPFMMNVGISFTKWNGITSPTWIGLDNYDKAMHDETFWASFKNNLYVIVAMTIIPTIAGLLLSAFLYDYVANKLGKGVASFFRATYYLPQILPVAIAGVVWRWILQPKWGVLNWILTGIGLEGRNWLGSADTAMYSVMGIMVWFQLGYPLVIFMAALQRVDPDIYEAASVDGANWMQKFTKITIHQIRPEIFVVVLMTLIHSLKIFAQIFVLTRGGPGRATIVPSYFAYQNFFEKANVGYGATISTIMTAIIILLTVLFISAQSRQELKEAI
ncbi:MAG TPA: sugar ABC transporter permease [Aggregatilinea sp.]|jgi:raffinose/stachyose/melibiose transport system permease protein|uniref:carbohydrate ABC transporter permease n=1 Tax=Aggregatilinea sp. TaxID=2806333 RepID=UPI002C790108|nr:sugar ABC transporter permease [Aggregatilinea sp.]HML20668.1 sugar ABC transporter permease [Aggregatilinea sp.]